MKILHTADLHIGKRVNGFSMLEDQKYILEQILSIARQEMPQAVVIAGDVYDKAQPPAEAVGAADEFITQLAGISPAVFIVSGNHDSPERLDFGRRIMGERGVYFTGTFGGRMCCKRLEDEHGPVYFWTLPFIKPAVVSPWLDQPADSYDGAVREVIRREDIDERERNVLVSHQFVTAGDTAPERSDSEAISVGGADNVDASAFELFDYVALGHLHGPQKIGRDTIRYAGSPLKYSFSEVRQKKSVTIVELGEKGWISHRQISLKPLRDMRRIKGPIEELIRAAKEKQSRISSEQLSWMFGNGEAEKDGADGKKFPLDTTFKAGEHSEGEDYIYAVLTDGEEPYDAVGRLRSVYPNLMGLEFERRQSEAEWTGDSEEDGFLREKGPMELFADFFRIQNGAELNTEQESLMRKLIGQAGERAAQEGESEALPPRPVCSGEKEQGAAREDAAETQRQEMQKSEATVA